MARQPADELMLVYNALMPALSKAAIGDFSGDIEIDPANPRRVNELLMGVEVLLEVIREKEKWQPPDVVKAQPQSGPITLLDEVLKKPVS